jgi:hypothetical protein
MSFCQHLSVIVFDQCHLFRKKVGLHGFIKKIITPELLEINNCYFFIELLKVWSIFCATIDIFFCVSYAYCNLLKFIFFKWQLPFLTLDINIKFNFKATFIDIVYTYF